uniref:Uncharacterized protein n=1 Tax=Ixodes ricinus TaxID=34613 RepID=A0A147BK01_IXORI
MQLLSKHSLLCALLQTKSVHFCTALLQQCREEGRVPWLPLKLDQCSLRPRRLRTYALATRESGCNCKE